MKIKYIAYLLFSLFLRNKLRRQGKMYFTLKKSLDTYYS